MREGPDIAFLGAMIGDPARASMLNALLSGKALTASELAAEAGVTPQTASTHLAKLQNGGLVTQLKQGRHRHFSIADGQIAEVLERLGGLSMHLGHMRTRTGPKDPQMRKSRVCYNHLASEYAVLMYDSLMAQDFLLAEGDGLGVTSDGAAFLYRLGIDVGTIKPGRRPLAKPCLDWSMRRSHLAGPLGNALLARIYDLGWARREKGSRIVTFTPPGERAFAETFSI
ncbi:MAG: ArsR/SmtB family transcription factor [Hyphomicrobiales bacterium]